MTHYQNDSFRETPQENSEALRDDIERTRNAMSHKIDRIQERVNPEQLKHQAQDVVRTAVQEGTDAMVGYVRGHASDFGDTLFTAIKRNPVPAALIGLGAGWILYESLSGHSKSNGDSRRWREYDGGYGYTNQYGYAQNPYGQPTYGYGATSTQQDADRGIVGQVRHQAEQVADTVGDKVSQATGLVSDKVEQVTDKVQAVSSQVGDRVANISGQTRHQVRQAGSQAQHLVETNPLSLGLAALAIGAAIGLALPPTRRESQIMGEWRDQVMEKAQSAASEVKQRVQEVVEEVKPELQQVAHKVADDVTQTSKAALSDVKEAVKKASMTGQDGEAESSHAHNGERATF